MAIEMYKGMNLTGTPSWHGTRDEYDNLAIHDPNTMYFIEDETGSCILWKGTREMFNNLPSEYKNDNTLYIITDESLSMTAENVSYDNATSGLTSDNVQDAIDEVNTKVGTVSNTLGNTSISGIGDGKVTGAISAINNNLTNVSSIVNLFKSSPIKATGAGTSVSFTINDLTNGTPSGVILGLCDFNGSCVVFAIPIHARTIMTSYIAQFSGNDSRVSASVSGNVLTITASQYSYIQLISPWTIS